MTAQRFARSILLAFLCVVFGRASSQAQPGAALPPIRTPLDQKTLTAIGNEVSGQMAFDNLVRLAGAPWLRDRKERDETFSETRLLHDLVRGYGIDTVTIERYAGTRTVDYPAEAEFWLVEPGPRLVARLGADAALVASGSQTADVRGELVYLPPPGESQLKELAAGGGNGYRGKVALMWAHPREEVAKALDAAGVQAVISFSSRERYFDPNQVVYSGGSYARHPSLKLGFTVSWRQWSELLEDVQTSRTPVVVRCRTRIESFPDRFEAVHTWIPGTEPEAKAVIFTAHLFEGYVKRGANDNMSGVVVQLEILRALQRLITAGVIPRPRRTIHFLWPNEISGTYEFIKRHPGIADTFSVNINMDMVGEWLRKNNSVFTMSECPDHLPCFFDGLAKSVLTYVWRTNDIVYLPDAPRGRPGGQYFAAPMVEKNGSIDAFRFFIHRATGGSDHVCFNNPSVAVPGIEFFTWPDQWYHADTDTPDKADPTELKRVAFIGAATGLVSADCRDEWLPALVDAVSEFGYTRVAERELPRALAYVEAAAANGLASQIDRALNLVEFATDREMAAIGTIEGIFTGSAAAKTLVASRIEQWRLYQAGLRSQVQAYGALRARHLGVSLPAPGKAQKKVAAAATETIVPAIHPSVKGREFSIGSNPEYQKFAQDAEAITRAGLNRAHLAAILNYVNGRRSVRQIRNSVSAETGHEVTIEAVAKYLEQLRTWQWVIY